MARMVKCLYCNESFDREKEEFIPVKNRYAHLDCFKKEEKRQLVILQIHEKMAGLLGINYSKIRIDKQIKELLQDGKSEIGILKALEYWYDVKNSDPALANGGIRIIGFIYGESEDYWYRKNQNKKKNIGKDVSNYLNPKVETYIIKPQPIRKPNRVKLFNIK